MSFEVQQFLQLVVGYSWTRPVPLFVLYYTEQDCDSLNELELLVELLVLLVL